MNTKNALSLILVSLVSVWVPVAPAHAQAQEKPTVQMPKPGVPQIMTLEGKFVRAAYNNEGYVILGYQLANRSLGEEWMLIEVGMTVRDGVRNYTLTRDALSLETPDGKTIPLPSISEHRKANTQALQAQGEGPARLDQLLSAEREPSVRDRLLPDCPRTRKPSLEGTGRASDRLFALRRTESREL